MNRISLTLILSSLVLFYSCTTQSEGYNSIESLYRESVDVIKSKDKSRIDDFITKIIPDNGTIDYMNKNKCE